MNVEYHSIYFYLFELFSSMSFSFVSRFLVKFITKYFIIFDAWQWKPDWRCTCAQMLGLAAGELSGAG